VRNHVGIDHLLDGWLSLLGEKFAETPRSLHQERRRCSHAHPSRNHPNQQSGPQSRER
jgi:hypothetical protein